MLLLLVGSFALTMGARHSPVEPVVDQFCIEEPPPAVELPTTPGPDVYALLDACLRDARHPWGDLTVPSVSQVRYWVEVEHDPAWLSGGSWWLPLSGEGEETFPSGIYISVPLDGSSCGGALVN